MRTSGSLGGDRGQPVPGKGARAPGPGGRLTLGAQALHCTRSGRTEATPRCALLWSAGNAARAKRDRKWQVRGPGTFRDMPSPRLCRLPLFTPCASLTSVQPKPLSEGAYPGPWVLPLRLPSSALLLSWARAVGPFGGRLWLGVCGGSAGRPSAPGRGDPGQTAPQSVLEWKPPSLFLIPPSHPFPVGQDRVAVPGPAPLRKPRGQPPLLWEQI